MPCRNKILNAERPPVDEWGIYDPEQAGLAALIHRLDDRRQAAATPVIDAASMIVSMRDTRVLANKQAK